MRFHCGCLLPLNNYLEFGFLDLFSLRCRGRLNYRQRNVIQIRFTLVISFLRNAHGGRVVKPIFKK